MKLALIGFGAMGQLVAAEARKAVQELAAKKVDFATTQPSAEK